MNHPVLSSLFSTDLAIDLGTANTLIFAKGRGIVVDEPSVIAFNKKTGVMEAVGTEAKDTIGRTPESIDALRPMKAGVIADFRAAQHMLSCFLKKAHDRKWLISPRVIIGVPSDITPVERRAVLDSVYRAKAREVYLVDQVVMGALGAGLQISEPGGNLIVDIGGGTSDVAVISLSGVVYSRSLRIAGEAMDAAIIDYLRNKYNLLIGARTAERIKINIGSAHPLKSNLQAEVRGRDLRQGIPAMVIVNDEEIRNALDPVISEIISGIRLALEHTPPELSGDIADRGIVLNGGGALLRGLDERIRLATGLPVLVAEDPLTTVVTGAGKMLNDFPLLQRMSRNVGFHVCDAMSFSAA